MNAMRILAVVLVLVVVAALVAVVYKMKKDEDGGDTFLPAVVLTGHSCSNNTTARFLADLWNNGTVTGGASVRYKLVRQTMSGPLLLVNKTVAYDDIKPSSENDPPGPEELDEKFEITVGGQGQDWTCNQGSVVGSLTWSASLSGP